MSLEDKNLRPIDKYDSKFRKEDIFLLPNILTYIRILLVPVFVIVYLNAKTTTDHIWSIAIVAISAITDVADGFIARKFHMTSFLGKVIDPLGDKLMQFAMLICVLIKFPLIIIPSIIFVIKEVINAVFSGYMYKRGYHINGSKWYGKVCTVVLYGSMLALIIIPRVTKELELILTALCSAFLLLAMGMYGRDHIRLYSDYKQDLLEQSN